jgi:hypothetical protein
MTPILHQAPGLTPILCTRDRGRCRTCELLDRDGPHYRADYRRLFYPEEFPPEPEPVSVIAAPEPVLPPPPVPQTQGFMLAGDVAEAVAAFEVGETSAVIRLNRTADIPA